MLIVVSKSSTTALNFYRKIDNANQALLQAKSIKSVYQFLIHLMGIDHNPPAIENDLVNSGDFAVNV